MTEALHLESLTQTALQLIDEVLELLADVDQLSGRGEFLFGSAGIVTAKRPHGDSPILAGISGRHDALTERIAEFERMIRSHNVLLAGIDREVRTVKLSGVEEVEFLHHHDLLYQMVSLILHDVTMLLWRHGVGQVSGLRKSVDRIFESIQKARVSWPWDHVRREVRREAEVAKRPRHATPGDDNDVDLLREGLDELDVKIMEYLASTPFSQIQVTIGEPVKAERTTVGKRLKRLRSKDLVARSRGPRGGEVLTDKGREVLRLVRQFESASH